jgi:hypothetical protein
MTPTRFEYKTTYLPFPYRREESGFWKFKKPGLPLEPDVEAFFDSDDTLEKMNAVARDGWILQTVQPVMKAVVSQTLTHGPQPFEMAYSITAGFALFWKRPKDAVND